MKVKVGARLRFWALAGFAVVLGTPVDPAELPVANGAGVALVRASAESYAGGEQRNGAGVTLSIAGAFDSASDVTNAAGVSASIGIIDPAETARNGAGVTW